MRALTILLVALAATDLTAQVIATDFGRRLPLSDTGPMVDQAMAYDIQRRLVVAFDPVLAPGVIFEWDGARWAGQPINNTAPATLGIRAGYDPNSRTVLFYGGTVQGSATADQWRWNGSTLTADGPQPPGPRVGHGLTGGAAELVLFGGSSAGTLLGDTWINEGSTWRRFATGGPSPRRDHAMAYSYAEDAVYLFGGRDANGLLGDFWRLDMANASWQQVQVPGTPSPREHAELVEGYGSFMLLIGGIDARNRVLDEVHDYQVGLAYWQNRGAVIDCLRFNAVARDYARDEVVVHGGTGAFAGRGTTWTADPEAIGGFPIVARSTEYGRGRTAFALATDSNPVLGASFVVDTRQAPASPLGTWLAVGRRGDRTDPLGLHLAPTSLLGVVPYAAPLSMPLPNERALSGTDVYLQAVTLLTPTTLEFSNSMRVVFGTR